MHLTHHGRLFYVGGHSSPSSAPLLVLREDLTLKRTLTGWETWALDDGRVIFERGMIHFAPAHSAILAIYDPKTNRDESFYPAGAGAGPMPERIAGTDEWTDRDIGIVKPGQRPYTIEFPVTTQRVGLKDDNVRTEVGAAMHERVTCDVRPSVPVCKAIRD